ncbi:MAG: LPXTG cell wall anchor domain-containing protein [Oscillospiraceae bacterium]|jgi:LPXTG-motif cell wall-anchored protein|nr:LPXTG cell wall anchor domain-containing protein [Oscillospiraceae bacterium]
MKKAILSLSLALVLIAVFAFPALAANIDLGAMNVTNSDTQKGWVTDGMDDIASSLTIEQLRSATTLHLEFSAPPAGGMQFIIQSDGDNYAWNQNDGAIPDTGLDATSIDIDLTKMKGFSALKDATKAKFFLGYYSSNIADLGITKAYLVTGGGGSAKTGDGAMIAFALMALVLAGGATVLIARKVKA